MLQPHPSSLHIEENVMLAPLTTIGLGGPARFFVTAGNRETVEQALSWARTNTLPLFVLGGGSNLVISDRGFDGLVVHLRLRGVDLVDADGAVLVRAAAGEPWDPLVARCVKLDLAGIECLSGIPGYVGATPIQNVGAYGQEVSETIVEVEALDRVTGELCRFSNEECGFAYRSSRFKKGDQGRYLVVSVAFRLLRGGAPAMRYPELVKELGGEKTPSLSRIRELVIAVRRRKGMVIDPSDPDTRSDGSFFMNPIIDEAEVEGFLDRVRKGGGLREGELPPMYPVSEGIKLSAAWLIERAGFSRGYGEGRVGLSTRHTLAIVNRGGATSSELLMLVRRIRQRVHEQLGIVLPPEPVFVGFTGEELAGVV
ncbi:MAG TPA: UDP-N-acetylmuramate dehydrogenase [Thermoanaerobaculia bacterium]|nr:UDP-N-acetylmuramate dehydrogenase [Thermoanaerobaculia bacterium]